jgi:hypothetical protein
MPPSCGCSNSIVVLVPPDEELLPLEVGATLPDGLDEALVVEPEPLHPAATADRTRIVKPCFNTLPPASRMKHASLPNKL